MTYTPKWTVFQPWLKGLDLFFPNHHSQYPCFLLNFQWSFILAHLQYMWYCIVNLYCRNKNPNSCPLKSTLPTQDIAGFKKGRLLVLQCYSPSLLKLSEVKVVGGIIFWKNYSAYRHCMVVEPTHFNNLLVKLDHFPNFRGEHKKNLKPPSRTYIHHPVV